MVNIIAQAELDLIQMVGKFVNEVGIGLAFVAVTLGTFIYLLPVWKENLKKKGEAFDNLSNASINLVKLSEAHKERIDKVDDEIAQHHKEFGACSAIFTRQHDAQIQIAKVACKGLKQYLTDEKFPEDKHKYLTYVEEIEELVNRHGNI